MYEKVIVRMDPEFRVAISRRNPDGPADGPVEPASAITDFTPYGMILTSIGTCTGMVLHSYAQNHGITLKAVTLTIENHRVYKKDCESCEWTDEFKDTIDMAISLYGTLTMEQKDKLLKIAHQCPIHKMLKHGFEVELKVL